MLFPPHHYNVHHKTITADGELGAHGNEFAAEKRVLLHCSATRRERTQVSPAFRAWSSIIVMAVQPEVCFSTSSRTRIIMHGSNAWKGQCWNARSLSCERMVMTVCRHMSPSVKHVASRSTTCTAALHCQFLFETMSNGFLIINPALSLCMASTLATNNKNNDLDKWQFSSIEKAFRMAWNSYCLSGYGMLILVAAFKMSDSRTTSNFRNVAIYATLAFHVSCECLPRCTCFHQPSWLPTAVIDTTADSQMCV